MDVLWGAWATIVLIDDGRLQGIEGVYDTISKGGKWDFPFTTDLRLIVCYQSYAVEYAREYEITLEMQDLDGASLFNSKEVVQGASVDTEVRWYEHYLLENVTFNQPGYYELNILVNDERRQHVPLWIHANRGILINEEEDSVKEMWVEDMLKGKDTGKDVGNGGSIGKSANPFTLH